MERPLWCCVRVLAWEVGQVRQLLGMEVPQATMAFNAQMVSFWIIWGYPHFQETPNYHETPQLDKHLMPESGLF